MASSTFRRQLHDALDIYGFLTTPQVAIATGYSGTDEAVEKRLRREKAAGYLQVASIKTTGSARTPCWYLSAQSSRSRENGLGYVKAVAPSTACHHLVGSQVALDLRSPRLIVATERQLRAEELAHRDQAGYHQRLTRRGEQRIRVMPDGSPIRYSHKEAVLEWHKAYMPAHRPDLRTSSKTAPPHRQNAGSSPTAAAWEIELTPKAPARIEAKLAYYADSPSYQRVVYLCASNRIADLVERAWTAAAPMLEMRIEVLDERYIEASTSRHSAARRLSAITPTDLCQLAA